jgi:phosphoglycerate dehydrogenase-like enzyme
VVHVAVLNDYQGVALSMADWSPLAGRVEVDQFRTHIDDRDELAARLAPYEVVVAMRERTPIDAALLDRLPNLRLVVTTGPFNAAIDVAAAAARGVVVAGTGGVLHNTSEQTWALILACARHIPTDDRVVKSGGWQTTIGTDLYGKRLGLVGLGRLGGLVADVGKAFGMELVAHSTNLTAERCAEVGATLLDLDELLSTADVVSIHLVLSERTRGLIGAPQLALMKPTAILVNTSRGPIVDEAALAEALARRQIGAAGIDVFGTEPLPADHPFRSLDNMVVTPHMGYVTENAYRIFFTHIVEDIAAFLDGAPIRVIEP